MLSEIEGKSGVLSCLVKEKISGLRRKDWWLKIAKGLSKMRKENYLKACFNRVDSLASWTKVISVQYGK